MIDNFYFYTNNGRYVEKTLFETEDRVIYADTTIELDYSIEDFNTLQFILRSAYAYEGDKLDTAAFTIAVTEAVENYNNPNEPFTFYSKDLSGAEMYVHGYFLDATHFYVMSAQGCCIHKVLGMTTSHVDEPEIETDTVYITNSTEINKLGSTLLNSDSPMFMPLTKKNGKLVCYDFPGTSYAPYAEYFEELEESVSEIGYYLDGLDMTRQTFIKSAGEFKNLATEIATTDPRYPLYVWNGFYYCEKPLGFYNNENFEDILLAVSNVAPYSREVLTQINDEGYYDGTGYYMINAENCGAISFRNWDTSNVTDMSDAFSSYYGITWLDVTNWDTSNVTNMSNMFKNLHCLADVFGLETWDVSKVTNMSGIFEDCGADMMDFDSPDYGDRVSLYVSDVIGEYNNLSQVDISGWNLASLTNASRMFAKSNIKIPLSLSTPNLENMSGIFSEARTFLDNNVTEHVNYVPNVSYGNNPILTWNTSRVTDMSEMFKRSRCIFNLSNINTDAVTDMHSMFEEALILYNKDNYCDTTNLFYNIASIEQMSVTNVVDMTRMFKNCVIGNNEPNTNTFTLNLSYWNTGRVENMTEMFYWDKNQWEDQLSTPEPVLNPVFATDISGFNTYRVKYFTKMFYTYDNIYDPDETGVDESEEIRRAGGDVSRWNTSSALDMSYMFYNGKAKGYSTFNTDFVTNMAYMFYKADIHDNLTLGQRESVEDWNTYNVIDYTSMFERSYFIPGVSNFRVNNVADGKLEKMFYLCKYGDSTYEQNYEYNFSGWDVSNQTSLADMFHFDNDEYESGFILDSTRPDPDVSGKMIGFDNWDTSNVESMENMFCFCPINLDTLDMSNWDFSNVTNISNMFFCAIADKTVLPPEFFENEYTYQSIYNPEYWEQGGYYVYPFDYCGAYTIECNGVDISDVWGSEDGHGLNYIFTILFGKDLEGSGEYGREINKRLFTEMIAQNWDVQDESLNSLFNGTQIYKVDLSGWDVSDVTDFSYMFSNDTNVNVIQGRRFDNYIGGVLDYSSLDNWSPSLNASFERMCKSNLQTDEVYAQAEGYHYGEQTYRLPQWNDGWWLNPNDLLYQSQNTAPDGSRYTLNSFDENEFSAVCNTGYYGGFVPNVLVDISAVYDEFTPFASTPLDNLKDHLEVTGDYSTDSASRLLNNNEYTLSGTLVADSTVTITATATDMNGDTFTDTFSVDVLPTVVSISAAFNQSTHSVYVDTPLNDLKQYLTVTGTSDGGGTITINNNDITLSGVLSIGTSAVLVSFNNGAGQTLTDTISVTVSKSPVSLTASFNQGGATITPNTPLNDLKQYLTVTALYNDMTSGTIAAADYTLSGALVEGTSVITASYLAPDRSIPATATFNVTVTSGDVLVYNWDFTSAVDPNIDTVAGMDTSTYGAGNITFTPNVGMVIGDSGDGTGLSLGSNDFNFNDGDIAVEYDFDISGVYVDPNGQYDPNIGYYTSVDLSDETFINVKTQLIAILGGEACGSTLNYNVGGDQLYSTTFNTQIFTIRVEYHKTANDNIVIRMYEETPYTSRNLILETPEYDSNQQPYIHPIATNSFVGIAFPFAGADTGTQAIITGIRVYNI